MASRRGLPGHAHLLHSPHTQATAQGGAEQGRVARASPAHGRPPPALGRATCRVPT